MIKVLRPALSIQLAQVQSRIIFRPGRDLPKKVWRSLFRVVGSVSRGLSPYRVVGSVPRGVLSRVGTGSREEVGVAVTYFSGDIVDVKSSLEEPVDSSTLVDKLYAIVEVGNAGNADVLW